MNKQMQIPEEMQVDVMSGDNKIKQFKLSVSQNNLSYQSKLYSSPSRGLVPIQLIVTINVA